MGRKVFNLPNHLIDRDLRGATTFFDNDPGDPYLVSDFKNAVKTCSGNHTVNAAVGWVVYDGGRQYGAYRTKNLAPHC